eukprot:TsM_000738100 transcript=TsM_000738100 gene=TsM_000738100
MDISASRLNVDDYKLLMNCEWHRCGAGHFRISKTQKSVLIAVAMMLRNYETSAMETFLWTEVTPSPLRKSHDDGNDNVGSRKPAEGTGFAELDVNRSEGDFQTSGRSESSRRKRRQAQQERMAQRNEKTGVPYEEFRQTCPQSRKYPFAKNKPKEIKYYLQRETPSVNSAHTSNAR